MSNTAKRRPEPRKGAEPGARAEPAAQDEPDTGPATNVEPATGVEPATDAEPVTDVEFEEVAQAADALFIAMRRSRTAVAYRDTGLTFPQLTLLEPLAREQRLPVGRLAAGAEVSVPTATRMLKQLEAKGVVRRERSARDERQVLVSLTEDGAVKFAAMRDRLRARQARSFEVFTPEERVQFVTLTRRLTEFIVAARAEEGDEDLGEGGGGEGGDDGRD